MIHTKYNVQECFFPPRQGYFFKLIPTVTTEMNGTTSNVFLGVFNEQRERQMFLSLLVFAFVYK